MELYLPIAQMSVHWLVILGMGFGIGYLSGMLGVGGGFLLTPMLMFYGIPPGIAVGTTTSQLTAITFAGVLAHRKRHAVDIKMGAIMAACGLAGTLAGIVLFSWLHRIGQIEIVISVGYVILLGSVGILMLNESVRVLISEQRKTAGAATGVRPGSHSWIQKLPLKMRFRESRLYISAVPAMVLGFAIGLLSSTMGVGGGFLMVPVMIYVLRMPTNVAIGTSTMQILFVSAAATLSHAVGSYDVDIVLALLLILGGVAGVQYGVRTGAKLRGVELRLVMALLVLAVGGRLLFDLIVTPADLYSVVTGGV